MGYSLAVAVASYQAISHKQNKTNGSPTNLSFEQTAVVGKLTAEVRYLFSKNRESQLSCCFKRNRLLLIVI
jgi:hypothetical protein